jgi:hypothetical protein
MAYSQEFLDQHRNINVDHMWWDSTYDDFKQICEILGIELDKGEPSFSGFCSQGDGASWTGRYRACALEPKTYALVPTYDLAPAAIREYAPQDEELHRIADELCMLARIYHPTYAKVGRHYGSNYVHSNTMHVTEWEYYDEDIGFEGVDTAIVHHIEETLIAQFRALADWLYKRLEAEYDHLTGDEAVAETLEANEIIEEEEEEEDA